VSNAEEPVRVCYVAGAGRSGSTLLECIVGELPGVVPAGEITHIWDRAFCQNQLCGCGRPFRECAFWHAVRRRAFGNTGEPNYEEIVALRRSLCTVVNLPRLATRRLWRGRFGRRVRRYGDLLRRLYRAIRDVSGARIVVDSSKYAPEAYLLRALGGIDLTVVHVVRNSNAVAFAWQKRKVRPDVHWTTAYMPRYPFIQTAIAWDAFNLLIEWLGRRGVPYHRVRYEDLVERTRETVAGVAELLGIERPGLDFVQADAVQLSGNHTASGNPVRFATGIVPLRLDGEWRDAMPRPQQRVVTCLTLPLQRRYGYR
jgi:hypothetical protein